MMEIETDRPVFSNANGNKTKLTAEQRAERRKRIGTKAKNILSKARESGILTGLENLALGNQNPATNSIPEPIAEVKKPSWWSNQSKTTKTLVVTGSLLAVSLSVWYFGFRKSPAKGK